MKKIFFGEIPFDEFLNDFKSMFKEYRVGLCKEEGEEYYDDVAKWHIQSFSDGILEILIKVVEAPNSVVPLYNLHEKVTGKYDAWMRINPDGTISVCFNNIHY